MYGNKEFQGRNFRGLNVVKLKLIEFSHIVFLTRQDKFYKLPFHDVNYLIIMLLLIKLDKQNIGKLELYFMGCYLAEAKLTR